MDKRNNCKKTYLFSLVRVLLVLFVALIVPRIYFTDYKSAPKIYQPVSQENIFRLGLENISSEFLTSLSFNGSLDYSVGLITNHTGLDQNGNRNIDILLAKGLHIKKVYIPEDDFLAYKKGMNWEMVDDRTKIPLVMLPRIDSLKKAKEYPFDGVDMLFFDMQDTGISPHSDLITLFKTLQTVACQHKTIVVLDRPNILGSSMEGIIADARSNDELIPVPMRHGMTLGELARHFNTTLLAQSARLHVVPMKNYTRTLFADAAQVSHASLLTNIDACYGSSFLNVLSSVAPFDVGIGTDMALSCLALPESLHFPKQKWFELRTLLKDHGIETSWYRYQNPKKKITYAGLRLMVRNVDQFSPFNAIVSIVQFFKDAGIKLCFSADFDRAFGGKKMRDFFDGKLARHDLEYEVNKGLKNFFHKAHGSLIYKPLPKIVLL